MEPVTSKLSSLGLDSSYISHHKLFISQIYSHVKIDNSTVSSPLFHFVYLNNRAISNVEIVGIIKSIKIQSKNTIFICDDGTGSIVCTYYHDINDTTDSSINYMKSFQLGDLVIIRGILIKYEPSNSLPYDYAIKIDFLPGGIDKLSDPNLEMFHWAKTMMMHEINYNESNIN